MLGRNHAMSGAVAYLVTAPVLLPEPTAGQLATGTLVCAAWALVPDLDHPGATVARRLGPAGAVASRLVRLLSGGHRQGTHSLLASVLVAGLAFVVVSQALSLPAAIVAGLAVAIAAPMLASSVGVGLSGTLGLLLGSGVGWLIYSGALANGPWLFYAVSLGFTLHWIGDALTPQGVPLLWPVSSWRLRIPLFRTGSPVESLVGGIMSLGFVVLAWQAFSPALLA